MDRDKKKHILLITLAALALLLLLILFAVAIYYFVSREPVKDYAVVFDAGSSGSRQYVYEWNADYTSKLTDQLNIKQISSCNTDDKGIHRINTYSDLVSKFVNCMNKSLRVVPEDRRNRTKISLAATAGMRLLQVNSKSVSNEIFKLIRDYFSQSGFLFQNDSQVKVISGRDEALNAWISANYFENNFNKLDNTDLDQKTKGIIDLGGASTQVVFVPKNPDPSRTESVKLFGVNYPTYSQSFLCYGLNEANLMYRASLLKMNRFGASCYPKNSVVPLEKLQLNRSPCANGFIFNEKMPYEALQKDHDFRGESNYETCRDEVKDLFLFKRPCTTGTDACSFKNAFIADVKTSKFLAISSFWYASQQTTKLLNQSHKNDIEEFKRLTQQICSMNLEKLAHLNQVNKGGIDPKRLPELCFTNVYVMALLNNYGFSNLENVKFVDEVNGFSVGWTLGYLINELNNQNYLPVEELPRKLSTVPFIFIAFALFLLMVTTVGLLLTYLISKQKQESSSSTANTAA